MAKLYDQVQGLIQEIDTLNQNIIIFDEDTKEKITCTFSRIPQKLLKLEKTYVTFKGIFFEDNFAVSEISTSLPCFYALNNDEFSPFIRDLLAATA